MTNRTKERIKFFVALCCGLAGKDIKVELQNWEMVAMASPSYLPERLFEFCLGSGMLDIIKNLENEELERIVLNNFIWGNYDTFKEIKDINNVPLDMNSSVVFKLIKEGNFMRVNVLHPMFLSDQHLVAEYREVKMGPKALSRSLGSLLGVDKNRISPKYTLNTGHTYFFYDKNKFLEKRLAQLVEEMTFRGIEHNFVELIDDKYDYHPNTFNDEWWNDWQPDEEALNVNIERINQRFSIKEDGWYRFWKRPVLDMQDIISTRAQNSFWECPHCKAVHVAPEGDGWKCWNCCKPIPANNQKISYF